MKYKIRATIAFENEKFWMLNNELIEMSISEIQDGIDSCELAIDGKHEELSWGFEVFELLIHKEISVLEYHDEFVAEIPTIEILKMLTDYKRALEYFEN